VGRRTGWRWRDAVRRERRGRTADWLVVAGAVALFVSLFLTWSHQFSPSFLVRFGTASSLADVPRDPTAWQVYSAMDVVLAALAVSLFGVALAGGRAARLCALAAAVVGIVFVAHAIGTPPTNGSSLFSPGASGPAFQSSSPAAGVGETVALVGLGLAVAGLVVSFTAD
jgi:hypothetical protein